VGRMLGKIFPSRQVPAKTTTQATHVRERAFGGSTAAMAAHYGVSERTVQRWMKGTRTPQGADAERLEAQAAEVQVTEVGRKRRVREYTAKGTGFSGVSVTVDLDDAGVEIKGSSVVRTGRTRPPVVVKLTGEQAAALLEDPDSPEAEDAINQALADYFQLPFGDVTAADLHTIH
jgi:DNA-binding transcriptional regulator YdaS (Cro superfamily)